MVGRLWHRSVSKHARGAAALVLALVLVGMATWWVLGSRSPTQPLEVSLWYWHSPFCLTKQEAASLNAMGVRRMFVRAGTISASGEAVALTMPQEWLASPDAPNLHLVFALDSGAARRFEELPNRSIAACVAESFALQRKAAERVGLRVEGLQIDFDCPTRLLPKYAELLGEVRRSLAGPVTLSITALPTWYTSRDMRRLVQQTDFYSPQFYETQIGRELADVHPVSDLRALEKGMAAAQRLGKPFYVGIPAYGHAFMYDDRGRLLGTYRAMSAPQAARHPSFRLAKSWAADSSGKPAHKPEEWIGEEIADFVAVRPGAGGRGLGYHLLYDLPTARMIAANVDVVKEHRPSNCLGVVIFRSPEPDEIMTLPLSSVSAGLRGEEPRLAIRASAEVEKAAWNMVEGGNEPTFAVTVSLKNTGEANSFFSSDSVVLILKSDAPGIKVEPGDFDRIERFSDSGSSAGPASASVVVCYKSLIRAGETLSVGPVAVNGRARVISGEWRARMPGGFETLAGEVEPVQLRGEGSGR